MQNTKFIVEITKTQNNTETMFKQFTVANMLEAIAIVKQYPEPTYNNYVVPADLNAYKAQQDSMSSAFTQCK